MCARVAPASKASLVLSICSVGVIGTAGLSFLRGTEPVIATVTTTGVMDFPQCRPARTFNGSFSCDSFSSFMGRGEAIIRHGSHCIYSSDVTLRPQPTNDAGRRGRCNRMPVMFVAAMDIRDVYFEDRCL